MSTDHDAATADQVDVDRDEQIEHRVGQHRFVLSRRGDDLAHLEYVVRDGVWLITHTFTERAARGHGLAARVTVAALTAARAAGVRVRPICPYVVDFMAVHPEFNDLRGSS